jgi:hypothetical protein
MLRDEHGMPFEGSLLAVVARVRRAQPFCHEVGCICENGIQTPSFKVSQLLGAQPEASTERRF